ncbi:ATP-dependent helicase HrpB [Microbacterium sp. YY-03]|uniref:ATP-dependent helicase HrpB n=1 Tax=Microbacterium sp. YY-03 TaxID=3421636 RepID=UPI003D177B9D
MTALFNLATIGRGLAFKAALDDVSTALDATNAIVITAAPGTGKTTLVPPLVANRVEGRVIVTQPRRVAARAAARRLASLDNSNLGDRVGFTVRGERSMTDETRIEMVTPGVLLRRLMDDPGLADVGAVILDEVHERAIDTDLLIGLLGEVRQLRDDIVVIAMSATVDAERFAAVLGESEPAPIVSHESVAHPLDIRWAPPAADRMDERGVTPGFLRHVAQVAADAHRREPTTDILVFAPGAREVSVIARHLRDDVRDADVLELHGQAPAREQDRAVSERVAGQPMRIIVATSIAESSLTVPGVSIVVDSCLSRVPMYDSGRGMSGLVTVSTPRASAVQRAGRAARLGPGTVIRCVDERTFAAAPAFATPEMFSTDLTDAALLLACWGAPRGQGLRLPDALPATALGRAEVALQSLGAVDADGRATPLGHKLARIPADPRLVRALLDGAELVGSRVAAEVIAAVSGEIRADEADLDATLRALRDGKHPQHRAWSREVDRFTRLAGRAKGSARADSVGLIVALAFPDRIARRVADGVFQLASGTRAGVAGELAGAEWLAIADITRATSRAAAGTGAVIRSAAALDEESVLVAAKHLTTDRIEATFTDGRVVARREKRVGAIVRSSVPVSVKAGVETEAAVRRALQARGLDLFEWAESAVALRSRLALLHRVIGEPWPSMSDDALLARLDEWLAPAISALAAGKSVSKIDLTSALRRLLPWPEAVALDELVPERLRVASGAMIRVQYSAHDDLNPSAVVAVKLQECFGMLESPRVAGGRVPVIFHLLSPGGHPLAVTSDLASFWAGPYAQVRAETRGRYLKHPWPEDPYTAVATAKTNRRLAAEKGD